MSSKLIAEAATPEGEKISLTQEGADYVVRIRGELLMSSRQTGSEQEMAKTALACLTGGKARDAKILIGGLGLGFTLRAVLNIAGPNSNVTVIELISDVVEWNRTILAPCSEHALDDPRVTVHVGDIVDYLASGEQRFDAIILDIDNGPEAFTVDSNDYLYSVNGLSSLHGALQTNGVMVLWSAFKSTSFEKRLKAAGFNAKSLTVRARTKARKGAKHTLFVASKGT